MRWRLFYKIALLITGTLFISYFSIQFYINYYLQNNLDVIQHFPSLTRDLNYIVSGTLIFAGAAMIILSQWITKPVEELASTVKDIAAGKFSRRAGLNTKDEVEEMSKSINSIVDQMKTKIDAAVSNQSRLEGVFFSMFDGVMVVDRHQVIKLMNQRLKELLHVTQDPVGKKPLEIIRNFEVQDIIEQVLNLNKPLESKELTVLVPEERILLIHATPVTKAGEIEGAILVFHDISELRRLENIRRDFVANVSHELRTPISTIKGYAETLLDGAMDDKGHAKEFIQIIHQDSERLAKLINDLLDLSRIESGKINPILAYGSLYEISEKVIKLLRKTAQERSVRIENKISRSLTEIQMDETMISQVFLNLIENAIKYNKLSGKILISAVEKENLIEVSIQDTGIGIPEEDLPRVFERFYRVDKSHSRSLGGTGLGLSIVKHIIQAHNGEVAVTSRRNEGSTFTFTLPKK